MSHFGVLVKKLRWGLWILPLSRNVLKSFKNLYFWWSVFKGVIPEESFGLMQLMTLRQLSCSLSIQPLLLALFVLLLCLSCSRQKWRLEAVVIHIGFMCQWPQLALPSVSALVGDLSCLGCLSGICDLCIVRELEGACVAGAPREHWSSQGTLRCLNWHHFPHWQLNLQATWTTLPNCEVMDLQMLCSLELGELLSLWCQQCLKTARLSK